MSALFGGGDSTPWRISDGEMSPEQEKAYLAALEKMVAVHGPIYGDEDDDQDKDGQRTNGMM